MLKDHPKTTVIALIIVGLSIYFRKLIIPEHQENYSHSVKFSFVHYLDKIWIKDLYANMKKGAHAWNDGSFTKDIAHCYVNCYENSRNKSFQYDPQCETFPILIYDSEITPMELESVSNAEASLPCFLQLADSQIPNAKQGIFSSYHMKKGFIFGPYTGIVRYVEFDEELDKSIDYSYTWAVNYTDLNGNPAIFEVDGIEANRSNWLRWVNSARCTFKEFEKFTPYFVINRSNFSVEEEQNMISMIFNKSVYYMTYKDVEPNTELLVWYGKAFADLLDISTKASSDYYWYTDFAPPLGDVICPTCPVSDEPEDEDEFEDEEENDENDAQDKENHENNRNSDIPSIS